MFSPRKMYVKLLDFFPPLCFWKKKGKRQIYCRLNMHYFCFTGNVASNNEVYPFRFAFPHRCLLRYLLQLHITRPIFPLDRTDF